MSNYIRGNYKVFLSVLVVSHHRVVKCVLCPRGNTRNLGSSISGQGGRGSQICKCPRDAVCRPTGVWICPNTHQNCPRYWLNIWLDKGHLLWKVIYPGEGNSDIKPGLNGFTDSGRQPF